MKLLVISDSPFYRTREEGQFEAFEPTLREIECLAPQYETVEWLGYDFGQKNPGYARVPGFETIVLKVLPHAVGGKNLAAKVKVVPVLPKLIWHIYRAIRRADVIHSRGPSVPAFICILLSFLMRKKFFWHKYAGNWAEPSPPFMYGVQKKLLEKASHSRVTVNGKWPGQPVHVISLENPCLTYFELDLAIEHGSQKLFSLPLVLCFSGLVAESKGICNLMLALQLMGKLEGKVAKLIVAGSGPAMDRVIELANLLPIPVEFKGYLRRDDLNEVYKESHILLLPSRSEGFPKVVAEAASFGCVPVVTDVSSIGQYIQDGRNGFLLKDNESETIARTLEKLFRSTNLKDMSHGAIEMSKLFTYERFRSEIQSHVLSNARFV